MKKVTIVTSYMSGYGGVEKVIERIYNLNKFNIHTISLSDGSYGDKFFLKKSIKNINWIPEGKGRYLRIAFSNRYFNTLLHVFYMLYYIAFNKMDVIIATGPMQIKYINKILRLPIINKRKVVLYGWPHFSKASGYGDFEGFKCSDKILCISKGIMNEFREIGVKNNKLVYFPNPFIKRRRLVDITNGSFYYIGRLQWKNQKNIQELLKAIAMTDESVKLKIVGEGADSELIEDYIRENKLSSRVSLHNEWLDDPWESVISCRGLILTSNFEGLPTVIGEAMSFGIPVISSNCKTGPEDFIKNGLNGYLYKLGDVNELTSVINKVNNSILKFDSDKIKESISFLYEDEFLIRFNNLIECNDDE